MNIIQKTLPCLCLLIIAGALQAQPLHVINNYKSYRHTVINNPDNELTALPYLMPQALYDLKYATVNNFMHRKMYSGSHAIALLRKPAALALQNAENELLQKGYTLKIFDAYRPYSVSKKFWKLVHDERYVANPKNGSQHNRGAAVDLTIADVNTKQALDMGTGFDNFSDTAHHTFIQLPEAVLRNRLLLKNTMEKYGFKALNTEWWHYTFITKEKFDVLDIPFKKFKKGSAPAP